MKGAIIFIFVLIVLIYGLINTYVLIRGWQAMEAVGPFRKIIIGVAAVLPMLFITMFFVRRFFDNGLIDIGWAIGSDWVAAMLYFLMIVIAIDVLRLALWAVGKSPTTFIGEYYMWVKFIVFIAVNIIVLTMLFIGRYNATAPKVNMVDITIEKNVPDRDSLSIVLISDLHLGAINGYSSLQRWVSEINKLSPDIVLIAGDMVDDSPKSMERKKLGELLMQIKAPLGLYAVQGNHELFGDFSQTLGYMQSCGMTLLLDTALLVDNSFYLLGRLDRSFGRGFQTGRHRKTLEALLDGVDHSKPLILLDHQPFEFDKTVAADIDLQLSGHTHAGQLWPLSLITKGMYEIDRGYLRKGNTHFYVSEGLGTWGPQVRIGTRSEIVFLKLHFKP
ncbi:MAG: metallophosphoesterase [Bacteroidales bacterium]|nr:metallophosphoesterase [Bacteroidales bacterium]